MVTETERRDRTRVALTASGDLGKVIGRQGHNLAAVRALAEASPQLDVRLDGPRMRLNAAELPLWDVMSWGDIARAHGDGDAGHRQRRDRLSAMTPSKST